MFSWFIHFHDIPEPNQNALDSLQALLRDVPGLHQGLIFTQAPKSLNYFFPDDGTAPTLALQLRFPDIAALESACAPTGALQSLADLPDLRNARATQQAMLDRAFPVPDPQLRTPAGELPATFLVHYFGPAENTADWLAYYIANHPKVMARFPAIRQIEINSRIDWCGSLPWPRIDHMQRNKVVFDSPSTLSAALNSPVIQEMRADFHHFPKFTGGNKHYPMLTRIVQP